MSDATDGDADSALALVADDTRRAILRALADAKREAPTGYALGFEALRERVGVADSGTFNYHLDRLRGRLIDRREDGYVLTAAGADAVGALRSGLFAPERETERAPLDDACPRCGAALTATYDGRTVTVGCSGHYSVRTTFSVRRPDERDLDDVLRLVDRELRGRLSLLLAGACPWCHAPVEVGVREDESRWAYVATCPDCGSYFRGPVGETVADHPAVVSFYHDHAVDVRERPLWGFDLAREDAVTLLGRDPLRLRVAVERDGDRLELVLDRGARVLDTRRVSE